MRINERLITYWQSLKTATGLPLESAIEPAALADVWDHCFLLRVERDRENTYTYAMLGKSLVQAYGDDWTGRTICEALLYPHPKPLFSAFEEVVATSQPHTDDNEFANPQGLLVKYRSCLVPLAREEGGKVAYILGGMKWKAY